MRHTYEESGITINNEEIQEALHKGVASAARKGRTFDIHHYQRSLAAALGVWNTLPKTLADAVERVDEKISQMLDATSRADTREHEEAYAGLKRLANRYGISYSEPEVEIPRSLAN